jgi:tripartite-type tricarboxylate transporter receptor subunit TctC
MKALVRFACAGLILLTMGVAGTAWGQAYPTKPIRLILGLPPGGMNDIVARIVSEQLTTSLGQPVIVDNRVGASGTIGASIAAKSPPDGYTIFMGSVSNIGIAPSQFKDLPYDPVKDFEPITRAASAVCVLVVNPNFPVKSTRDLIAMAKQKPGALTYASAGQGSSTHLTAELFNSQAGIQLVNVPYKGDGPGVADVMAGHVPVMFPTLPAALQFIKAGKLRPIAVSSIARSTLLPDVPTVAESGVPDFEVGVWVGFFAPAGTPKEIVSKLNTEIVKILRQPAVRERFAGLGLEAVEDTPAQFATFVKAEIAKWSRVSKAAGVNPN